MYLTVVNVLIYKFCNWISKVATTSSIKQNHSVVLLQLEKRVGWKILCSQQELDCCVLTWTIVFPPAVWAHHFLPKDLCSRLSTLLVSEYDSPRQKKKKRRLPGDVKEQGVQGYVPSMHDNFISSVTWEINKYTPTTNGARCEPGMHRDVTEGQRQFRNL